jgi:hypothetical protein
LRALTLGRLFGATGAACLGVIAFALLSFWRSSSSAALQASERSRHEVARAVEARVAAELSGAERVLDAVERALAAGLVASDEPSELEALLYTELLGARRLAEVTFTAAQLAPTRDPEGSADAALEQPELAPGGRLGSRCSGLPMGI